MVVFLLFISITAFAAIVFEITCLSVVFTKAEKPWWGCIVPIYSIILLCDIAAKPRRWTLLCLLPFVNIYAYIVLSYGIARHFEKSDGFGLGLVLLPVIFYAILAFGDADYTPFELEPEGITMVGGVSAASPTTRPQREVASPSDSVRQRPRLARCPFCRSTTFRVVEESGSRRCGNCHSVLPSYAQGNE